MIVVTGATGNVGRPLVDTLAAAGHAVTAVSRASTQPLPERDGVRTVVADLADPDTLTAAFDGAEALFLLVSGSGAHLDTPRILRTAIDAGIARIVLLSSQAAGTRPGSTSHAPMALLERQVEESGAAPTILRPGGFHTNALAWVPTVRAEKAVYAPFGDVALPSVDPLDIAEVAAAALTDETHAGRTYVLTGPEAMSPRQRTDALAAALGHPLTFVELAAERARDRMREQMPEAVVEGTLSILGEPTPSERAVSPDVEAMLGRSGHSFADWARRHVAMFG